MVNVNGPAGQLPALPINKFYAVGPMQNITTVPDNKEIAPMVIEQTPLDINAFLAQALKLPFLQNINDLRNYYNENAMTYFFKHLQINEKLSPCIETMDIPAKLEPIEIEKESYPIAEYGFLNQAMKSRSDMERKGLAPLGGDFERLVGKNKYSTLFCPAGFEFFEHDEILKTPATPKKILDSEYLQFYIPKQQVTGIYKNKTNGDFIMSQHDLNSASASDENVMLEVWCKIFHIRELSANINL